MNKKKKTIFIHVFEQILVLAQPQVTLFANYCIESGDFRKEFWVEKCKAFLSNGTLFM